MDTSKNKAMVPREFIESLREFDELSDRLERVVRHVSGNIVEIGGGEGINTIRFLLAAREAKTTVIVVDPFEQIPGADKSYFEPYTYEKFIASIKQKSVYLADHLRIIKKSSQDPEAWIELGEYEPIGFVFVDGLQDRASVFSDLKTAELLWAEVICVDDYDRLTNTSEVPLAVKDFIPTTSYKFIDIGKREAYFIK